MSYRPEVVDQQVENAQDDHQHDSAEFRLESHNDHHACHKAEQRHNDSQQAPLAAEDESDEEEDQEDSASKLEVHLAVLLLDLRESSESLRLADPGVRENHQQSTHD